MYDFVWLHMVEDDMLVGLRPSQVACMVAREQRSMLIGDEITHRVDIYLIGQNDEKPIRVAGTPADISMALGLPVPLGAEKGTDGITYS